MANKKKGYQGFKSKAHARQWVGDKCVEMVWNNKTLSIEEKEDLHRIFLFAHRALSKKCFFIPWLRIPGRWGRRLRDRSLFREVKKTEGDKKL